MSKYSLTALKLVSGCLLALLLVAFEMACEPTSTNPVSQTSTPTPFATFAPKGPGSANLTATARATFVPPVCTLIPRGQPANTSDWPVYTDPRFPFHFSFPPDWRAGATTDNAGSPAAGSYIVQVFPPASKAPFSWEAIIGDTEHFDITILLTGPISHLADQASYIPESDPITLNHKQTTLYDGGSACAGIQVHRFAEATFGKRDYIFHLKSLPDKAQHDILLFLGMLQSFSYTG